MSSDTNSPSGSTAVGPSRIFIVRHGDRMDHEDHTWRQDTTRPHDSPLSRRGHRNAHLLGRYLALHRGVGTAAEGASGANTDGGSDVLSCLPSDIVFLASPLQRTVETAHGIICGILSVVASNASASKGGPRVSVGVGGKAYAEAAKDVDALLAELALDNVFLGGRFENKRKTVEGGEPTLASKASAPAVGIADAPSHSSSSSSSSSSAEGVAVGASTVPSGDSSLVVHITNSEDLCGLDAKLSSRSSGANASGRACRDDGAGGAGLIAFSAEGSSPSTNQEASLSLPSPKGALIPIFLEPGAIEGEYWLNTDVHSGCQQGNTRIKMAPVCSNSPPPLPSEEEKEGLGDLGGEHKEHPPHTADHGVYRTAPFHRQHVSPFVQLEGLRCPNRNKASGEGEGGSSSTATTTVGAGAGGLTKKAEKTAAIKTATRSSDRDNDNNNSNTAEKIGFGDVAFNFDAKQMRIIEKSNGGVVKRCHETIQNIAASPLLTGKTVIVIGHGETTKEMVRGLMYCPRYASPYYTSFTEGVRFSEEELAEIDAMYAYSADGRNMSGKPERWQRWKVADGTVALDSPHIRIAKRCIRY